MTMVPVAKSIINYYVAINIKMKMYLRMAVLGRSIERPDCIRAWSYKYTLNQHRIRIEFPLTI